MVVLLARPGSPSASACAVCWLSRRWISDAGSSGRLAPSPAKPLLPPNMMVLRAAGAGRQEGVDREAGQRRQGGGGRRRRRWQKEC